VHIITDVQDADELSRRYGQLKRALTDRFEEVTTHYRADRATRHNVPFNRGTFLRLLGLVIRIVTNLFAQHELALGVASASSVVYEYFRRL
jgi:hypothetical protein